MKKTLFFLLLLAPFFIHAQDRKALLSAALKNSNAGDSSFLLRDSVVAHFYYDAESDSTVLADLKREKYISQADVEYMTMQLKNYKAHAWSKDSIEHAHIVPSAKTPSKVLNPKKSVKAWNTYFTTYKSGYYEVSEPVFSKDGNLAIVYVSFQCGANCGNGGATLYKYEKGAWKPVKNLFSFSKQPH